MNQLCHMKIWLISILKILNFCIFQKIGLPMETLPMSATTNEPAHKISEFIMFSSNQDLSKPMQMCRLAQALHA